ncbi:hypothetical protein ABZW18_32005 [Streptomyces sp. NPDC004647]|uniref:hypothetical protein n=1 Tax=Streptomyces sp. NPDC004647 TaxID=3154671 RepID=UPI0033AF69DE
MQAVVQRTWTVELRPQQGGPVLACRQCAPATGTVKAASARSAALAHLARHARRDALPLHLRICQCHERGCRWHPRHRGCSGPILLVLMREHGGRIWRLADACTACASITAHAAVVPETVLTSHGPELGTAPRIRQARHRQQGPGEQVRVHEMLSYLAAALATSTNSAARLLAVQCALRSTATGGIRMSAGLLRGMRLGDAPAAWHELEQDGWLRQLPRRASVPASRREVEAQLLDSAVLSQVPGRSDRARAADWALRVITARRLRGACATVRLIALVLTAHPGGDRSERVAEADGVAHLCCLPHDRLVASLDQLVIAGVLAAWAWDRVTDDLRWQLRAPGQS